HASALDVRPAEQLWLVRPLWQRTAVGIVGGPPKCASCRVPGYAAWEGLARRRRRSDMIYAA
ncbi:MAG: hypothetical protein ACOY3Y_01730, partial [Acidobacteriota bacterium]